MRLASNQARISAAGAEVIGVSVDSPEASAAMAARWRLPFKLISDPGGDAILGELGIYNPDERDGIAIPTLYVISPSGEVISEVGSRDFADRVHDEDVIGAIEARGWSAIETPVWVPEVEPASEPVAGAVPVSAYIPYFKGNQFGAYAVRSRLSPDTEKTARDELAAHMKMSASMVEAFEAHMGA